MSRLCRISIITAALLAGAASAHLKTIETTASPTYTNPVTRGVVDTFPDPSMIRGKDGAWYAYGTTNPIFHNKGEKSEHVLPILRSSDMVHWSYVGDVFAKDAAPGYWPARARVWAPDIRYLDGHYVLTYALSSGGIALASSQRPAGPWTDHGLIVPAKNNGCPTGAIDSSLFTDTDGIHYLYWGSYDTVCVSKMNAAATALTGPVTPVLHGRRAEGNYLVHRHGYYYLFYSVGGCCDGVFSGYTVKAGRARSPRGPFVTPDGQKLTDLRSKGGIVASANGNGWVGPGHNAIQTDLSGQDWLVYHAIPAGDPDFPPIQGARGGTLAALAKRPMMIDRLDWIDGWPVLRAGAGPSSAAQPAPVTIPLAGSTFNHQNLPHGWRAFGDPSGHWSLGHDSDALGVLVQSSSAATATYFLSHRQVTGNRRVEGDLKLAGRGSGGAVGLVVSGRGQAGRIVVWLDRDARALIVSVTNGDNTSRTRARLPGTFDYDAWHNIAVSIRGTHLTAQVAADRLHEPLASVSKTLAQPPGPGCIGAASRRAPGMADNISAAHLYTPITARVPVPQPGKLLAADSDDFNGHGRVEHVDSAWHWIRGQSATATEHGGVLRWPTQPGALHDQANTASVLLRAAPSGDFMVETKLAFDGTQPGQRAGLVLYENDDRYLALVHAVRAAAHLKGKVFQVTEFDKEGKRSHTVPPQPVFNGPMFGGPPATTTWLRLACHYDPHRRQYNVRMASSTNDKHWIWGGDLVTTGEEPAAHGSGFRAHARRPRPIRLCAHLSLQTEYVGTTRR